MLKVNRVLSARDTGDRLDPADVVDGHEHVLKHSELLPLKWSAPLGPDSFRLRF